MAHNHEAGGSSTVVGEDRPHSITLDEAAVLHRARLLVPPEYRLSHGLHLSSGGYAVSPLPEGAELRMLIDERRAQMPPRQRDEPRWVPSSRDWAEVFQREQEAEIARFASPDSGRFNRVGRRSWWHGRGIDVTLAACGYHLLQAGEPPCRPVCFPAALSTVHAAHSRSSCSGGRQLSAPYPPPRGGGRIVIRDAALSSSSALAPPPEKETAVKKEEAHSPPRGRLNLGRHRAPILLPVLPPPPPQPEKKWWEVELEMQAAYRGADDPEDAPGQHLLLNRSFNEDMQAATERQAEWWSAIDSNSVVDLDGPAPAPALAVKPEDDDSDDFKFGSDDDDNDGGDDADSILDYSAWPVNCDTLARFRSLHAVEY